MKTDVLHLVKPEFHQEFLNFIDSGEASQKFCDYLDHDKDCQKAVEIVFDEQWKELLMRMKR